MIEERLEVFFVKKFVLGKMIYNSSPCAVGMIDKRTLQIGQIDRWSARKKLVFVLNVDSFCTKHRQVPHTINRGNLFTVGKYSIITEAYTFNHIEEIILICLNNPSLGVCKRDYSSALCSSMIHKVDGER